MADNVDVVIEDTIVEIVVSEAGAPGVNGVDGHDGLDGVTIVSSATPPTDTTVLWHDTTDNTLNFYDGNVWVCIGAFSGSTVPAGAIGDGGQWLTDGGSYILDN